MISGLRMTSCCNRWVFCKTIRATTSAGRRLDWLMRKVQHWAKQKSLRSSALKTWGMHSQLGTAVVQLFGDMLVVLCYCLRAACWRSVCVWVMVATGCAWTYLLTHSYDNVRAQQMHWQTLFHFSYSKTYIRACVVFHEARVIIMSLLYTSHHMFVTIGRFVVVRMMLSWRSCRPRCMM